MLRERQLHVATWSASDDPRLGTVAGFLEADGFAVHPLGLSPADLQLVLMLPGCGGPELPKHCRELCQAHPNAPAMILHTAESEASRAAIDYYGFELLPASIELAKVPEHVLKVLSPWSRFAELKRAATTLQHLESTAELVYFDFRPEAETFRPSRQLRELIGQPEAGDVMPPSPLLDRIHTADRALFAGTLFEAARSGTPFASRSDSTMHTIASATSASVAGPASRSTRTPRAASLRSAKTRPSICSGSRRPRRVRASTT
jgi:hypothetical protein